MSAPRYWLHAETAAGELWLGPMRVLAADRTERWWRDLDPAAHLHDDSPETRARVKRWRDSLDRRAREGNPHMTAPTGPGDPGMPRPTPGPDPAGRPTAIDRMEAARLSGKLGWFVTPEQVMADRLMFGSGPTGPSGPAGPGPGGPSSPGMPPSPPRTYAGRTEPAGRGPAGRANLGPTR